MKKQLLVVVITLLLIAVGLSGCTENEENDTLQFETFVSEEGGFSILMPGTPTEYNETINSTYYGEMVDVHMIGVNLDDVAYAVAYKDYSDAVFETYSSSEILDFHRDVETVAQVTSENNITIDGYSGREFCFTVSDNPELEIQGGEMISRCFIVDNRFYAISISTYNDIDSVDSKYEFLDSFELI